MRPRYTSNSTDDKLAEIKRLYFKTTRQTFSEDLAKALDLLKSMPTEEERERATSTWKAWREMRKWRKGRKR